MPGMLSGGALLLATTYAFIEGGRSGTGSPEVGTAAAIAVAAPAEPAAAESRRGGDAMLPPALLRRPAFTAANTTAGIMNPCSLGTLFVLMLFLQSVQHRSALLTGLTVVPLFAPLAVMAPIGGRVTSRFGPRLPAATGLLVAAGGLALLARAGTHSGFADLLPAFLLRGTGCGLLTPAVVAATIATVPVERSGLASAVNDTARQRRLARSASRSRAAVVGQPGDRTRFLRGFHAVVLGAACCYAAAAVLALLPGALTPTHRRSWIRAAPRGRERPGRCDCALSRTSFPIGGGVRVRTPSPAARRVPLRARLTPADSTFASTEPGRADSRTGRPRPTLAASGSTVRGR